ncbi:DUF2157 domain-containing protein [Oligoflexia bacterium]|nr:DUF2157 domain-containing protein [Oligoflexia bacterium]
MRLIRLFKKELAVEAKAWTERGLITEIQGEEILALYGAKPVGAEHRSFGYFMFLALSALLVGLGVIVLISHNWEEIPRVVRLIGLIGSTLGCNALGVIYFNKNREHLGRAWFILGSLMYGASIFLIAQIYHLQADYTDGILLWSIGLLPIAFLSKSISIALLTAVLSGLWMGSEYTANGIPWLYPLFPTALLYFVCKLRRSIPLFILNIVGIVTFLELLLAYKEGIAYAHFGFPQLEFGPEHVFFSVAVNLFLFSLGHWLESRRFSETITDYGMVLRLWAMRFGVFILFVFSFEWSWEELIKASNSVHDFMLVLLVIFMIFQGMLIHALSKVKEVNKLWVPIQIGKVPAVDLLSSLVFIAVTTSIFFADSQWSLSYQLLSNLLIVITGMWFICSGIKSYQQKAVLAGMAMILILAFIRYVDLIGSYVGTSVLFLGEGLAMLCMAHFMKQYLGLKTKFKEEELCS